MRNSFMFYQKHHHPVSWDLTPDFTARDHSFRYNSYPAYPVVKPVCVHDLIFAILAFVLGLLTLGFFFSGTHDGILFWLSVFFPVCTVVALLKK